MLLLFFMHGGLWEGKGGEKDRETEKETEEEGNKERRLKR